MPGAGVSKNPKMRTPINPPPRPRVSNTDERLNRTRRIGSPEFPPVEWRGRDRGRATEARLSTRTKANRHGRKSRSDFHGTVQDGGPGQGIPEARGPEGPQDRARRHSQADNDEYLRQRSPYLSRPFRGALRHADRPSAYRRSPRRRL